MKNKIGHFFIIVGCSGVGKDYVIKRLISEFKFIKKAISHTTRKKRKLEIENQDYYFISKKEYLNMLKNNQILMHYQFKPNKQYYGTSKKEIFKNISQKKIIIDQSDEKSIYEMNEKNLMDKNLFSAIWIMPTKTQILKKRLKKRKEHSKEEIDNRLNNIKERLELYKKYKKYFDLEVNENNLENIYQKIKEFILKKTKNNSL